MGATHESVPQHLAEWSGCEGTGQCTDMGVSLATPHLPQHGSCKKAGFRSGGSEDHRPNALTHRTCKLSLSVSRLRSALCRLRACRVGQRVQRLLEAMAVAWNMRILVTQR